MNKNERIIKKGKILIFVFVLLSLFNIIILINNKSFALFRTNVQSKKIVEIHTASEFPKKDLTNTLKDSITNHTTESCKPTVTDEKDGTIYFSGTNDCVNFNYVWYSGKLWRITAINSDNTIKRSMDISMVE